jgi:hypothetical protein
MRRLLLILLFIPLLVDAQQGRIKPINWPNGTLQPDTTWYTKFNDDCDSILKKMCPENKIDPNIYREAFFAPVRNMQDLNPIATISPTHTISIRGNNKEELSIDLRGDSVIVSGDLKMNEAAKRFIDFLRIYVHTKIDSLENELYAIKYGQIRK